jgi:hypothetical protein
MFLRHVVQTYKICGHFWSSVFLGEPERWEEVIKILVMIEIGDWSYSTSTEITIFYFMWVSDHFDFFPYSALPVREIVDTSIFVVYEIKSSEFSEEIKLTLMPN